MAVGENKFLKNWKSDEIFFLIFMDSFSFNCNTMECNSRVSDPCYIFRELKRLLEGGGLLVLVILPLTLKDFN